MYPRAEKLFGSECNNGILACRALCRNKTGYERQSNAEYNEPERLICGKSGNIADSREPIKNYVNDSRDDVRHADAEKTCQKSDDKGLCVEEVADVLFAAAERADNADLLDSFNDRNVGDNAYHNGGNDKRYRGKGDKSVGDDVYHRVDYGDDE